MKGLRLGALAIALAAMNVGLWAERTSAQDPPDCDVTCTNPPQPGYESVWVCGTFGYFEGCQMTSDEELDCGETDSGPRPVGGCDDGPGGGGGGLT